MVIIPVLGFHMMKYIWNGAGFLSLRVSRINWKLLFHMWNFPVFHWRRTFLEDTNQLSFVYHSITGSQNAKKDKVGDWNLDLNWCLEKDRFWWRKWSDLLRLTSNDASEKLTPWDIDNKKATPKLSKGFAAAKGMEMHAFRAKIKMFGPIEAIHFLMVHIIKISNRSLRWSWSVAYTYSSREVFLKVFLLIWCHLQRFLFSTELCASHVLQDLFQAEQSLSTKMGGNTTCRHPSSIFKTVQGRGIGFTILNRVINSVLQIHLSLNLLTPSCRNSLPLPALPSLHDEAGCWQRLKPAAI